MRTLVDHCEQIAKEQSASVQPGEVSDEVNRQLSQIAIRFASRAERILSLTRSLQVERVEVDAQSAHERIALLMRCRDYVNDLNMHR